MKRPHSAKPIRNFIPQVITEDGGTLDEPRHFIKAGKRHMLSAVTVASDLSRLMPKKIHHDKQQLYHDNLQLKSSFNEIVEQNLKLKTKVALFQREKDRLHKTDNYTAGSGKSSSNLNAGSKGEKQNGVVNGLKKLLRQTRQENDALKAEVARLKKSVRHTKLNEFQIEKQTIYDQNKKLAKLVQQYEAELTNRMREEKDVEQLEAELNEKRRVLKQVTADNIRYEEILEEVQEQCREASEKLLIQEKKWQRNSAVEKRRCEQLTKHVEVLKAEVKSLNEALLQQRKKAQQKKPVRPASSHPYQNSDNSIKNKDIKQKEAAIEANSRLRLQLDEAKKKLIDSQNKLKDTGNNMGNLLLVTKNEPFELNLTKEEPNPNNQEQEEYGSDFEETKGQQPSPAKPIKENPKGKNHVGAKLSPIMIEIKELLTYRLKYNRYTFQELKSDIEVSPDSAFLYEDLMAMLQAEPFYLNPHLATHFLRDCYGRQDVHNDDELDLHELLSHLRLVVDDFELRDEEEEERMLYSIAQNLTKNRKKLEEELGKVGGKSGCVTKEQLTRVLRAVSRLSEEEMELAICYISNNTDSLQSIGYVDFLDRFFIANSKSLSHPKPDDDLSLGENEHLDEGELIAEDELI